MGKPQIEKPKSPATDSKKASAKLGLAGVLSFLANFFTASHNIIGIDIGSSYIKILQLQKRGRSYLVRNCITRALPQTAKDNTEEKKKLVNAFVKEFVEESRTKTNLGRLAVYGKGIFIFSLTVPNLNKKDLRSAVIIELKKRLPFQLDVNNVMFDYVVTGQAKDEKGVGLQLTCIAADRITIEEQVELLKEMNIRPIAINTIPDCLGNLIPHCFETPPKKTVALLDMGANTTLLNFYKGKNLIFSREIPIGGEHLTHAMAKPVQTPAGTITINPEDAEKLKRNCGIPLEDEAKIEFLTDFGPFRGEQISAMLRPTLERLVMEISRTFNYYTKTFKSENILELYITGGNSRLKNIDKFLLFNMEGMQKVESLNILKAVKGWADTGVFKQELVMEQAAPHLAVAFGLCLETGGKINLLPIKERLEQKAVIVTSILRFIFPAIFLLSIFFYALSFANGQRYKALIENQNELVKNLEYNVAQVRKYMDMKAKLDQRKDMLEKVKGKQPYWWGVFKEISNITPKDVILQKINAASDKQPKEIQLFGKIFAKYTIVDMALSQYVITLEESPFFENVKTVSTKNDMYSPIPAADFEIVCQLTY
jgi:type IV pilus assembly protein PilM